MRRVLVSSLLRVLRSGWVKHASPAHVRKTPRGAKTAHAPGLLRAFFLGAYFLGLAACSSSLSNSNPSSRHSNSNEIDIIADELEALSGGALGARPGIFREILKDTLNKDPYLCLPRPEEVFGAGTDGGERIVQGLMPHYGLYYGPMHYMVRRGPDHWEVQVRLSLVVPRGGGRLELPDCNLKEYLNQPMKCEGTPYSQSGSLDACPGSGVFETALSRESVRALLERWSREAEDYYNRDAKEFHLNVHYDFEFVTEEEARSRGLRVDMRLPLSPSCGRTPYFLSFRSGWSLPIVAHEVGHFMGLLDEYEMFSGLVGFYPKTPFTGAEMSRMALSMKENTKVLPIHHYLILRRYFCDPRRDTDPYGHVL